VLRDGDHGAFELVGELLAARAASTARCSDAIIAARASLIVSAAVRYGPRMPASRTRR